MQRLSSRAATSLLKQRLDNAFDRLNARLLFTKDMHYLSRITLLEPPVP